jgi:hypothetical protein
MADVLDLADALNKLMPRHDVSSEFYARPRRWVTGLEIMEDDDGQPVNPFSDELGRVWQSESPRPSSGSSTPPSTGTAIGVAAVITSRSARLPGSPRTTWD